MNRCSNKKKVKDSVVTIRLTEEENKRLNVLARVRRNTKSGVIREIMKTGILSDDQKTKEIFKYIGAAARIIDEDEKRRKGESHERQN